MVRLFVLLSVLSLSAPATLAANGHAIKQRADAVLTLMSYTVVPDVTASDLNIGSGSNDKHNLAITQFGGGATLSESFPLYLEGTMGYSRYDPRFVVSNGEQTRNVPTKWNSLTTTAWRRLGFFAAPGQPRRQPGAAADRQCDARYPGQRCAYW